jgi:hypothetical protein
MHSVDIKLLRSDRVCTHLNKIKTENIKMNLLISATVKVKLHRQNGDNLRTNYQYVPKRWYKKCELACLRKNLRLSKSTVLSIRFAEEEVRF